MTDRFVKVVGKHRKDCYAIRNQKDGTWNTCWGPVAWGRHGDATVDTFRKYGKKGYRNVTWVRFVCNDTNCRAELHIEADQILFWATGKRRK